MRGIPIAIVLLLLPLVATAQNIEERVEELERRGALIQEQLEEQQRAGSLTEVLERVSVSGAVEIEAYYARQEFQDTAEDADQSDVELATVELGFLAEVADQVWAVLVLDWEEEDPGVQVDQATIDYEGKHWHGRLGRHDVPFGVFPSHFVTDPLTDDLGATQETALAIGYRVSGLDLGAFLFNGDAERRGDEDHIKDWGLSLAWTPARFIQLGASFLSDLADTDEELVSTYRSRVSGGSAFLVAELPRVEFSSEVVSALWSFKSEDLDEDEDGSGDRPAAWNVEMEVEVIEDLDLAVRLAGSREFFEQPEWQYGLCVTWGPWSGVDLSAEYLRGDFDRDFGDGLDSEDRFTFQAVAEF